MRASTKMRAATCVLLAIVVTGYGVSDSSGQSDGMGQCSLASIRAKTSQRHQLTASDAGRILWVYNGPCYDPNAAEMTQTANETFYLALELSAGHIVAALDSLNDSTKVDTILQRVGAPIHDGIDLCVIRTALSDTTLGAASLPVLVEFIESAMRLYGPDFKCE